MAFINRFVQTDFSAYEDFAENYKVEAPEKFNYAFDVVDEIAALTPEKKALIWCNDKGEEKTFNFEEVSRRSNQAANFLINYGIKKGDAVMLILKRHYQYWYTAMALHKIGAVIIPATHLLTAKDIVYRVEAASIKMIITSNDAGLMSSIDEAQGKCAGLVTRKAVVNGTADGYLDFDKEVAAQPEHFIRPEDIHLTVADTGWAKASWGKLYGQWLCEAAVFVYDYDDKFQPIDLIRVVAKHRVTTFCAPPTIFRFLIKEDLASFDLSALRACYIAGEPLNPEVYKRWYEITGIKMREGFGQSETPVLIAAFPWIEPKPGSTGMPSPSLGIQILDERGTPCEVGEEGEICISIKDGHPFGIFTCYYKDEDRTGSVMFDGYYHTGDMAWKDEDGYIWFVGRGDDVIKSSGYRIGPFEVESALLEHPAVLETAITAVPDPVRGQVVKATVVLVKGAEPCDKLKIELQEHVKRVTAPYKYPCIVEFVEELPKTISGKIKRRHIRDKDSQATS